MFMLVFLDAFIHLEMEKYLPMKIRHPVSAWLLSLRDGRAEQKSQTHTYLYETRG